MSLRNNISVFALLPVLLCTGCDNLSGRPLPDSAVVAPNQVLDFNTLYAQNCAGCHGTNGKGGASIALDDPIFLAIADDAVIHHVTSEGVPGTQMPGFAKTAGGMLTDQQIDLIVHGIRSWEKPEMLLRDGSVPSYIAEAAGDARRGESVYASYCSSCHGPNGDGGQKASSIVNPSYLALVSNQYLRIVTIAGRPEIGFPDWRNDAPGHSMSSQDISDVVAWLSASRSKVSTPTLNSSAQQMPRAIP
jgi:mono/diheme cytochrome c family protein